MKFLSRFVHVQTSPVTAEYMLIACAMAFALLALMPILASSLNTALGR